MRYVDACTDGEWSVATWKKDSGEDPRVTPYRCKSWRHEGPCREHCGALDFARVLQAISEHAHWTYLVLTYPCGEDDKIARKFKQGVVHWGRLRKRLITKFGSILYIQTWEVHKSMHPHLNVIVSNAKLHQAATDGYEKLREDVLNPMCNAVGFGYCTWAEPLRDQERMAGYITKLGLELTGAHHKDQTPVNAPRHFRRIRASRGLLPKRFKDDTMTGQLFRLPFDTASEQFDGTGTVPLSHLSPSTEKRS